MTRYRLIAALCILLPTACASMRPREEQSAVLLVEAAATAAALATTAAVGLTASVAIETTSPTQTEREGLSALQAVAVLGALGCLACMWLVYDDALTVERRRGTVDG